MLVVLELVEVVLLDVDEVVVLDVDELVLVVLELVLVVGHAAHISKMSPVCDVLIVY